MAIPAPSKNTTAVGLYGSQQMPLYSFNKISAADRSISIYNATITQPLVYLEGDPTSAIAETRMTIVFTVASGAKTVVLAWGGHIASRLDWGGNNSSGGAGGTPHRTRLITLDGKGGNQERVATAFFIP
ncbi:MAG: hypothetical protein ACKO3B_05975, partial [Bacteroidota bacterium]